MFSSSLRCAAAGDEHARFDASLDRGLGQVDAPDEQDASVGDS
jgi:hypothetical protein